MPASRAGETRLRLFAEADFRRLWYVGLIVFVVRWLETLAVAVFVWQATGSAFVVAMLTMLRLLPMGLFGALLGAVAERMDRRLGLLIIVVVSMAVSLTLAGLAFAGSLAVWHLAVASFINGLSWAADNPVRRMMMGEVVGPERMAQAMSLDVGSSNASRMLGPTVGGLVLASVGIEGTFILGALLYATALPAAWLVRLRPSRAEAAQPVLARMAEGWRAVRRDPRLVGILTVTVIFNVFGWPFTSMVPVVAQQVLGLGTEATGLLASLDGVGAFCGAVALTFLARPSWYKRLYVGGLCFYLLMVVAFALAPGAWLAGLALFIVGFGHAGFSTMQPTLLFLAAPPELRSRVLGILSVAIGTGPIGFLHVGLLADAIGVQAATALTGAEGLVVLALTWRWWRRI
jgi:MFS family permease